MNKKKSSLSCTFNLCGSFMNCSSDVIFSYLLIYHGRDIIKELVVVDESKFYEFHILKTNVYGKFSEVRCKNTGRSAS